MPPITKFEIEAMFTLVEGLQERTLQIQDDLDIVHTKLVLWQNALYPPQRKQAHP